MSKPKQPLTADRIRKYGADNPEWVKQFSDHDRKAFAPGARGRLPKAVREAGAKALGQRFTEGTVKHVPIVVAKVQGGRTRKVTKFIPETEARRLAGDVAGKRGPLSQKALLAAGANYKG